MATTAKPPCANASATANMSSRLRVMPCWKITTGQPPAGAVCPEVAFGTVTSSGISSVSVGTGSGLKRVVKVLVVSSGKGGACQNARERRAAAQVIRHAQHPDVHVGESGERGVDDVRC